MPNAGLGGNQLLRLSTDDILNSPIFASTASAGKPKKNIIYCMYTLII
jgi:hypothetical protein